MVRKISSSSFAPEIWIVIANWLAKKDLSSLSRTSRSFLELSRPILFKELTLGSEDTSDTLEYLSKNPNLAKALQRLTVLYDPPERGPNLCLCALQNTVSLKSLRLVGSIFNDNAEQAGFVNSVIVRRLPIEEFYFYDYGRPIFGMEFSLPFLTTIGWKSVSNRIGELFTYIKHGSSLTVLRVFECLMVVAGML